MSKKCSGLYLMSLHNLHFLLQLMREVREAILQGRYAEFARAWLLRYESSDRANAPSPNLSPKGRGV